MPDEDVATPDNDAQPVSVDEQVAEWKPPASQEELDRIISDRLNRATKKYRDYDAVKEKAGRLDALEHEMSSETEKQVRAAREEESSRARQQFVPRLVRAEFRAERGDLTSEQLEVLLEDLDLSRYVDDEGEPDVEKIRRKISAVAPPKREPVFPDLGGGNRGSVPSAVDMNQLIRGAFGRA